MECGVGRDRGPFHEARQAKLRENMHKNSNFTTKRNEIYVQHSGNFQNYVTECCESESDGKSDCFATGCCKRRGKVAVAV
jgi:hypothetical protein